MTTRHVLVAGGGIAGLAAAFELSEDPDVRITVLEAEPECGGKMRGRFDEGAQRFEEHSIRALGSTYFSLFDVLHRAGLLDRLVPVDEYLFYERSSGKRVGLDRTKPLDPHALAELLREFDLAPRDMLHLAGRILHHVNASAAEREALATERAGDVIGIDDFDPATREFVVNWFGILTGARMHSKAVDIMDSFLLMFMPMSESLVLPPGKRSKSYCFDRPTSEVVDALCDALRRRGVEIRTNVRVRELARSEDGVRVATGDDALDARRFDAAVLALPHEILWTLGFIDAPRPFDDEWSFGSQFPMAALPEALAPFAGRSYNLCFDAPWNIVFQVQHAGGFWTDVPFPKGRPWNLSATCSSPHANGALHGKPFDRCTPDEALHEVLFQLGIEDETERDALVREGAVDPIYLEFADDRDGAPVPATTELGERHVDGRRWIDRAQIYVRSAADPQVGPATHVPGVYLAGEVVTVPGRWKIPTMEQASTSGKQAAAHVFGHLSLPTRVDLSTAHVEHRALARIAEIVVRGLERAAALAEGGRAAADRRPASR